MNFAITGLGIRRLRATQASLVAILAVTVVLLTMVAAKAAETFLGLTFPDRVAGAELGPTTDFEKTNPGLGYGVRYRQPGWTIDVYIYDEGLASISDDPASGLLKSQLQQAKGDILELQRRGDYTQVEVRREHVMNDPRGRARFRCLDFAYAREKIGNVDSFLCLAGWNNKFVKFRLTTARHAGSDREAKRFVESWFGILWP